MIDRLLTILRFFSLCNVAFPGDEDEEVVKEEDTEDEVTEDAQDADDSEDEADDEADDEEEEVEEDSKDVSEDTPTPTSTWNEESSNKERRKLRQENAKRRLNERKLQEEIATMKSAAKDEKKQAELADMEEVDRLKAELDDKQKQIDDMAKESHEHARIIEDATKENAAIALAAKKGFLDPQDAVSLLGNGFKQLEVSETGIDDQELEDLLDELLEQKPYLKKVEDAKPVKSETSKATNQKSEEKVRRSKPGKKDDDETEDGLTQNIRDAREQGKSDRAKWQAWKARSNYRKKRWDNPHEPFHTQ